MSLKGVVRILNLDFECQAGHFPVSLWAPFEWGKPSVASPDRSCRHLIVAISFCCSTLDERKGKVENGPVTPSWSLFTSNGWRSTRSEQLKSSKKSRPNPGFKVTFYRSAGNELGRLPNGVLCDMVALLATQLRNLIRACCVPPPVTDREEKVVSAKINRKPTASPALEDLLMLKRAAACDVSFCVGYHCDSALYRNSPRRLPKPLKLVFLKFQNGRSVRTSRGV